MKKKSRVTQDGFRARHKHGAATIRNEKHLLGTWLTDLGHEVNSALELIVDVVFVPSRRADILKSTREELEAAYRGSLITTLIPISTALGCIGDIMMNILRRHASTISPLCSLRLEFIESLVKMSMTVGDILNSIREIFPN